jgi:hypothetical protein
LNPKFRYAAGQTYTYNFQARSKTWMMGTSDDEAVLEVKGQALVTFRDSCDAVLQLRQATISGLDEKVGVVIVVTALFSSYETFVIEEANIFLHNSRSQISVFVNNIIKMIIKDQQKISMSG